MAKISIISGAFNISNVFSFEKSMESILTQTFSDFEFIICDDGSTDNTWNILSDYAKKDNRIVLIKNEKNMGLAFSLNRCIKESSSNIIARHDLDDYSEKNRLEVQYNYLMLHPEISVLGTNSYLFDESGVWGKQTYPEKIKNDDFLFTSPYKHGSVMMRKEALEKAGYYRVSKETFRTEDYDLFMTMQTFSKGENLQDFLYYFCENLSAKKRRKYKYRIDETKVRFKGFKKLKLMPKGFFYAIKPLIVGLIPQQILTKMQNKHYKRLNNEVNNDR